MRGLESHHLLLSSEKPFGTSRKILQVRRVAGGDFRFVAGPTLKLSRARASAGVGWSARLGGG